MTFDEIKALPTRALAADDCAVFAWVIWPTMPIWHPVLEAWGVAYSGLAFDWIKLNPSGEGLHWGTGYGTRANPEPCILGTIGNPLRLDEGVHSVIMAPVGEHSEKPDEAYCRMARLFGGPCLELFARKPREGWTTWGNEVPAPKAETHIRERVANGGPPWTPREPLPPEAAAADDDGFGIPAFLRRNGGAR
jgi:N6-adenosine-specific RNA methylase IME4